MKAVYFYMDTVVAVKSLWNGKRFATAKWKSWRTLTDKDMMPVASRKEAEENLQRWADKKGLPYAGCHGCKYLSVGVCDIGNPIKRLICRNTVYFIRSRDCHFRSETDCRKNSDRNDSL